MQMSPFLKGMRHGIPIALGYLSVSFGFGILAAKHFSTAVATIISASNLTSAGQLAGLNIMAECAPSIASFLEMALTQLIINMRYGLMGISLSQKLDGTFNTPRRMLTSFGITDEIFAVASSQEGKITARYLYGMILIAFLGWTGGTFLGASAGEILPQSLTDAMGLALYGMFLAIIIPPARKSKGVLLVVITAAALSLVFKYLMPFITSGFAVILCAVAAAALGAFLCPVREEENA
ncbi:MAG: AzlC family ABC transporter permease [Oscillospiraceae bacterium]|jgi:predicted branched-subunit amino acid permease|nr:AzlC family ABC transporter permease [Oscillospiraceae bacterium]MBQ9111366.1 AzlC family ABC transporter permease [Oscillospiraceae bacterium]